MTYPEHEKLHTVKERAQIIGEFLDWLTHESPYFLCEYVKERWHEGEYAPVGVTIEQILSEFFEIDRDKLETEKREMLAELRGNTPEARKELGLAPR